MLTFFIACVLGLGFLGFLPKSMNTALKFVICPVVGLLIFTEFTLLNSFLFGVGLTSILISLLLLSLTSIIAFKFLKPDLKPERVPILFIIALLTIIAFSSYIYYFQLLHPRNGSLETGGGGLYGDTALHLAYTSRIQTGEFPPQNPLFAGKILVYPYANDLLSAVLRINGLNLNYAFILPQLSFLIGFLTLFYVFCRKFTSDKTFLISLLLFSLGWGLGFVYFLNDFFIKGVGQLNVDYTNNTQFNLHFHNVFTGLIFPERSFLPGLFIVMWIFLNFLEYFQTKSKRFLTINSILVGILPFWHVHSFIFTLMTTGVIGIYLLVKNWKENLRIILILPFISLILALPFIFLFFNNHSTESFLKFTAGWETGSENFMIFWFRNSFLVIPLAIFGFMKLKPDLRVLFTGPFIAFIVANLVIFQPWSWDNIKLLSLSFLFFAILAGFFLNFISEKGLIYKTIVIIVIFISCISGSLSVLLQLSHRFVIYDKSDIELGLWAKTNTKVSEVFLIDPTPNHPIPGLAGRLVYVGYPGHLWVHGIDYYRRESLNKKIMSGNLNLISETELPISYVVIEKNSSLNQGSNYKVVFKNNKYLVLDANLKI